MLALVAVVAFLALTVCLFNLVLTLGVIRRLREHTELISNLPAGGLESPRMLAEGETVPPFEAVTTTGEVVSRDTLAGGATLVGVFATLCEGCVDRLPSFADLAGRFPGGRAHVLAVVIGAADEAVPFRERLEPVARVVVESHVSGVSAALGVKGFPVFGLLDGDGTVVGSGIDPAQVELDPPAAAPAPEPASRSGSASAPAATSV